MVLGAVVFIAIVIVVVGTVWLSENFAGASGGYKMRVQFETVPGLQRGNRVTFRGVRVGKVLEIYLKDGQPIVVLGFSEFNGLPRDSRIFLKSDGLLGGQMIEIQMGTAPEMIADGELVRGISESGIERMMDEWSELTGQLQTALNHMTSEKNLTHIGNTVSQLDSTTRQFRDVLTENRGALTELVGDLSEASGGARQMVDDNQVDVRKSIENLRQATEGLSGMSQNMEAASTSLRQLLANMNQISEKIQRGEGTLGSLVQDDQVYRHLQRTLTSVDSLLEDIKRDPTRYFNFSVF